MIEKNHTYTEWYKLFGNDDSLWDFLIEDVKNGAVELDNERMYWEIDDRIYETTYRAKKIRIKSMMGEPSYAGREGYVQYVDDAGQMHGTWGGCAVDPNVDEYDEIEE